MKQEVWLLTNRRALALAMLPPALAAAGGTALVYFFESAPPRVAGALLCGAGIVLIYLLAAQLSRPRLSRRGDRLLFWLGSDKPFEVPLEVVECFFLGQAEAAPDYASRTKVVSIVARVAESATEYHERNIKPALGRWTEGYITIRGTWCEPLNLDVAKRLNARLRDAQSAQRCADEAS